MKKIAIVLLSLFAVMATANAQKVVEMTQTWEEFSGVSVSNNFDIQFSYAEEYAVVLHVDELISEYVRMNYQSGIINISLDEKSYSKELKKLLKSKNAPVMTLKAEIRCPKLSVITLVDKVTAYATDNIKADILTVKLKNNAVIKGMNIDADDVGISLEDKSSAAFDIYSRSVELETSNNASANLTANCSNIIIGAAGSSNIILSTECKSIEVKGKDSSVINATGSAKELTIDGSSSAEFNAAGLNLDNAEVVLSKNAKCDIVPQSKVKVDLTGSSYLCIGERGALIDLVQVKGSTLVRSNDSKKKK